MVYFIYLKQSSQYEFPLILDEKNGPPPEINLFNEKNNGETVLKLIKEKLLEFLYKNLDIVLFSQKAPLLVSLPL